MVNWHLSYFVSRACLMPFRRIRVFVTTVWNRLVDLNKFKQTYVHIFFFSYRGLNCFDMPRKISRISSMYKQRVELFLWVSIGDLDGLCLSRAT